MRNKSAPAARRATGIAFAAVLVFLLSGCGIVGAKPWERDLMARKSMQPDPHPLLTAAADHIHFSKEASSGGRSFAGGGCGCN